ncbi:MULTISPECIES: aldo/keto reductase [unclassified Spirosoma]|uniref:aldo/keto reductase n=1 Tax=unclassified Spirosoma TaxID=2621999 RepID=UPI0009649DCF|nr:MULTISPECIES: aldo/keto reductase [unclassified Spirosoma]MBN8825955.1 aldo/keto reductase [Spirosoma sp.]OJW70987.1 MAG: glyoxal reductase [Spirosoma sp. 48-14]
MNETVTLNNGVEMPLLGLGVYAPSQTNEVQQAVEWALEAGCRLIDTAAAYGNEREVADAIRSSGIPRSDIFITTKVWNDDQGYNRTLRAFNRSLERLRIDSIDLYLVHWPVKAHRHDTWRALEKIYSEGRARAIGISNHYPTHIDELLTRSTITPALNQIEFSPYCFVPEVLDYCQQKQIQVEGYAPLVRGQKKDDPRLIALAEKYGKSTFQLLIRWSLQHGAVTIPKSVKRERIQENFDVWDFTISDDDMALLDTFYDNTRIADDPRTLP